VVQLRALKQQPFCDGSHVGIHFLPVRLQAERDEEVIFCGCKHSGTRRFAMAPTATCRTATATTTRIVPRIGRVAVVSAKPRALGQARWSVLCLRDHPGGTQASAGVMSYTPVISYATGALYHPSSMRSRLRRLIGDLG